MTQCNLKKKKKIKAGSCEGKKEENPGQLGVANHQVPSFLSGSVFRVQGNLFLEMPLSLARV